MDQAGQSLKQDRARTSGAEALLTTPKDASQGLAFSRQNRVRDLDNHEYESRYRQCLFYLPAPVTFNSDQLPGVSIKY